MAGVEQDNFNNEEFIEEVARYECVYHRNSKDFKDKNKKLATEAQVKFGNIRTAYISSLHEAIENATFWRGARCAKRISKSVG